MNVLLSILAVVPALLVWQQPSLEAWLLLFVIGVVGTCAQVVIAQSLKEAEAGLVMPFDFFKLLWAALFGYLLFGELPDAFVWVGAAIVVGATSYLAFREAQVARAGRAREGAAAGSPQTKA